MAKNRGNPKIAEYGKDTQFTAGSEQVEIARSGGVARQEQIKEKKNIRKKKKNLRKKIRYIMYRMEIIVMIYLKNIKIIYGHYVKNIK